MRENNTDICLEYKQVPIVQFGKATGGKNQTGKDASPFNGFYRLAPMDDTPPLDTKDHAASAEYFVKFPKNKTELFLELFAGKIVAGLKPYLPPAFRDGLICADWIKAPNGEYGLIQPKKEFTELFKLIHTGSQDGSDRSAPYETFRGTAQYSTIASMDKYHTHLLPSLALCLLISLIIGNYSVHSGNIIYLKNESGPQFGEIDWGGSLRDFRKNGNKLLLPYEYKREHLFDFNLKWLTKNYINLYRHLPNLYPTISQLAVELKTKLNKNSLKSIILNALASIPTDMLTPAEKAATAEYIGGINSFKKTCQGEMRGNAKFAEEITNIMLKRLSLCTQLYNEKPGDLDHYYAAQEERIKTLRTRLESKESEHSRSYVWNSRDEDTADSEIKRKLDSAEEIARVSHMLAANETQQQKLARRLHKYQREQCRIAHRNTMILRYSIMWTTSSSLALLSIIKVGCLISAPFSLLAATGLVLGGLIGYIGYKALKYYFYMDRYLPPQRKKPIYFTMAKYSIMTIGASATLKAGLMLMAAICISPQGLLGLAALSVAIGIGALIGYGVYLLLKKLKPKRQPTLFTPANETEGDSFSSTFNSVFVAQA